MTPAITGNAVRMLGKAGEHIACADLFLGGWVATIASEGQGYDILAERGGRVVRVAVKATLNARQRRDGARDAYVFHIHKRRPIPPRRQPYTIDDCDVIALVAIDQKTVAYLPILTCPTIAWLYKDDAVSAVRRFGPRKSGMRRFADLTMEAACG